MTSGFNAIFKRNNFFEEKVKPDKRKYLQVTYESAASLSFPNYSSKNVMVPLEVSGQAS
jgi:hypothetical protein